MPRTRVSDYFGLGRNQASLDFVDVAIHGDTKLYVDPRALRLIRSPWGQECVALIQDFFQHVLDQIRDGNHDHARYLLAHLREPNEVHLGQSRGRRARGRALGRESAHDVWEGLSESEAVKSGLLEDLEDTILMIRGISSDKVSDIAINLMRGPLMRYTVAQCGLHGIPLQTGIASGALWDPDAKRWYEDFADLPVAGSGRLLLVPKAIVRTGMDYDPDEYFNMYVLTHMQARERDANSELVRLLKDGTPRVTKKDLVEKYGKGKDVAVSLTREFPEILEKYRKDKRQNIHPILDHQELAGQMSAAPPDWDALLNGVLAVAPGPQGAGAFQGAVEALLSAVLYPSLTFPEVEFKIHDGRKRVDIVYLNTAKTGFFAWLAQHQTCPYIFVECKNYAGEVANPELDQLSGRFSRDRGNVGFLVCRQFDDKEVFIQRCRDTARDGRGYIIPLDDNDLRHLTEEMRGLVFGQLPAFAMLRRAFDRLMF